MTSRTESTDLNKKTAQSSEQENNQKEKQQESLDWRHSINWEQIYKTIVAVVVLLIPFFLNDIIQFRAFCDANGLKYLPLSFTFNALLAALALTVYRNLIGSYMLTGFVSRHISKKYHGVDRDLRVKKVVKWITDIVYYSSCSIFACWAFGHKKWFPLSIKSEYGEDMFEQFPHRLENDVSVYMEYYLCIQFGQHIYALLELIIVKGTIDPKFYEYLLHHVLAFTLIVYSVYSNIFVPGVAILLVHDVSDIFLAFFKAYGMFRTDLIFYINVLNMIVSWFITRIVLYPKGIIMPLIFYRKQLYNSEQKYQVPTEGCYIYMLTLTIILQCMHIYWFATMFTMLSKHIKDIFKSSKRVQFQNDFDFHRQNQDKMSKEN